MTTARASPAAPLSLPVPDKIPWETPSLEQRAVEEGKAIAVFTVLPQYEIFAISAFTLTWAGDTFLREQGAPPWSGISVIDRVQTQPASPCESSFHGLS